MKPVKGDVHFPTLEKEIQSFWDKHSIVEKNLKFNEGKKAYVFYDGPPFATGLPHYGHILAGTLKDIVPRYWVMKGYYVERRWGWDCHGLPVEFEMEKELGLVGRDQIEKFGIAKFNEACRGIVLRYTKEWQEVITRTGRWVDFKNQYRTMDATFMESVWWVFKELWEKKLIFEGYRVMPYSWHLSTPLSNFEAGLNYKEVQDPALTVRFRSVNNPKRYFLAWTTTPWTLPSNLGLSVHPDTEYVEVKEKTSGDIYVVAKDRLSFSFADGTTEVIRTFSGKNLEKEAYEPLFPYFKEKQKEGAFIVMLGEHVTTGDGTGIVHTAPAFGEDDFAVCKRYGVSLVDPVDVEGRFTSQVPDYKGQNVKEADKNIIKDLKAKGAIFKHETLNHSYPFCWRSDTPLIYKAISTWFVALDPLKKNLVANNSKTHWVPENLRDGRFGNWLENARDWNISRNRFWGTPLPVWKCTKNCGTPPECLGSIAELTKRSGKILTDLHKHFVDEVTFPCLQCKAPMKRIEEVLDCWFESGSMPYGQNHYPFENKEKFEKNFPADFIAEGLDQTRGWFYTLSVLGTALFNKAPFKHVVVNGLVLAEDGKKMSKRLKNYPDPAYLLDTYGADSLRAYLTTSPAAYGQDLRFSEAGLKEIIRSVILPYWNAYSFLVTYANADGYSPDSFDRASLSKLTSEMDRWILSRLQSLTQKIDASMEAYHVYELMPLVTGFIDELTNWYIRLSRRRFWVEGKNADKDLAYATLYFVLHDFSKLLAPILPFVTEEVFQNLRQKATEASIHLASFPRVEKAWVNESLEKEMGLAARMVGLGRAARNTSKLKTRQPLKKLLAITKDEKDRSVVERYKSLIAGELNVKTVEFSSDESKWVTLAAKANAKILGPRLGQKMKTVLQKVAALSATDVEKLERDGKISVEGEWISKDEVVIERKPKEAGAIQTEGGITIWIDTTLTEELVLEGLAREVVNRVQKLRKDKNLEVTDRIHVYFEAPPELKKALEAHRDYVSAEILAGSLSFEKAAWDVAEDVEGNTLRIAINKI